jgi:hypothetical protein
MKPITINLPFRTISLSYNSDAPLSAFEQTAIEKYTALHNETYELKELITRLINYYTEAAETQEQCLSDLNNLQNEYLLISPMIHYYEEGTFIKESEINKVPEEERVGYDTQSLFTLLEIFKYSYHDYIEPLKMAEKDHEAMIQMQEKVEKDFDEFDENYFSPIIHDYNNMEIDTVSFDEDFDNFRGSFSEIYKLGDQLCDARNAFVAKHTPINDRVAALDKDLTVFFDVLKKLDQTNRE